MAFRGIYFFPADSRINFMKMRKLFFALSAVMIIGSLVLIPTRGLNFGIDFVGGVVIVAQSTSGPADLSAMRSTLSSLGLGEVGLQQFGEPTDVRIRVQRQPGGDAEQQRAVEAVKSALGDRYEYIGTEFVGPKVGEELIQDAAIAVVLTMLGIMAYIWFRYEWQFGINALIAVLHDVITTVGLFALIGLEFNLSTVAAVLTIAGYSVNDTVVVYDRVREELRRYKKMPLPELINLALNRTLSRTVMTSGLTLLAVLALYLFGGEVIRGFSLAMIWGILIGTYSTVFVATPMLIYMNLRRGGDADKPAHEAGATAGTAGGG